jgi:hypothetical protein
VVSVPAQVQAEEEAVVEAVGEAHTPAAVEVVVAEVHTPAVVAAAAVRPVAVGTVVEEAVAVAVLFTPAAVEAGMALR